jgi:transaldolase
MELFVDSAKLDEISKVDGFGLLDGVTTNPSLMKKAVDALKKKGKKVSLESYIKKILKVAGKKPVSLEVVGTNYDEMVSEGRRLYKKFGKFGNVYIKIPVNPCVELTCSRGADGIKAIRSLSKEGIKINCTLVFTPEQALLAAKAGAKFVSPFVGREDDYIRHMGRIKFEKKDYFPAKGFKKGKKILRDEGVVSGIGLIEEISKLFRKQRVRTKILAASIRNKRQFREAAEAGADIATLPFSVIKELTSHNKTAEGMKGFVKDIVPEYAGLARGR